MHSYTVYLILTFFSSFCFTLSFTVNLIYHATAVGLNPLQMVLVGTMLEVATFLFEIPTGVVADVKSRRLSILIGYFLLGIGFLIEGLFPFFWTVLVAQVFWGIGWTFTSGAQEAWIADELGEKQVSEAFVRGSQMGSMAGLIAVPVSVLIGRIDIAWPIVLAGAGMLLLFVFLLVFMKETGFTPLPASERSSWASMVQTTTDAWHMSRGQVMLLLMLAVSFCWGLYCEGFDRLWTPFMIQEVGFPAFWNLEPVVWFGILSMVGRGFNVVGMEILQRCVNLKHMASVGWTLVICTVLMVVFLFGVARADGFWIAAGLSVLFNLARRLCGPLYDIWFNAQIKDPKVRATLFSASGQVDALGQAIGGPAVGWLGLRMGLRFALQVSAVLISPVVGFYGMALKKEKEAQREVSNQGWD